MYNSDYEHDACGVGFIASIQGAATHKVLSDAQSMLENMTHRTALSADNESGDGSGVMVEVCHEYFSRLYAQEFAGAFPESGQYAIGNIFLPSDGDDRGRCTEKIKRIVEEHGLVFGGIFPVDTNDKFVGEIARIAAPAIGQILVVNSGRTAEEFDLLLYIIRKKISNSVSGSGCDSRGQLYICSLSSSVLVYKGMLTPYQLFRFYTDLQQPEYVARFAMVHSRFSTNTFPAWSRAQPNRCMSHNGEINTLRGNINKMRAREGGLSTGNHPLLSKLGIEIDRLLPIIEMGMSDSGTFDNVLEFLIHGGYTLPQAVFMMMPEAWENNTDIDASIRAAYDYASCKMEPWDGPAMITYANRNMVGAALDRNGLRPCRYYITHDDHLILASEVGTVAVDPRDVRKKGRLMPGKMVSVDFQNKQIVENRQLKEEIARQHPYAGWLGEHRVTLAEHINDDTPELPRPPASDTLLKLFGYTSEHINLLLKPMIATARDPIGSMGNDAALAILSQQPKLVFDYFHQLFAQVTNPPIDSIREKSVMSLRSHIGPEAGLLCQTGEASGRLLLDSPILTGEEFCALREIVDKRYKARCYDLFYDLPPGGGSSGEGGESMLQKKLAELLQGVEQAIDDGHQCIVLSDRNITPKSLPISSLLAVGAIHQHLVKRAKRTRVSLIVDSAEPRTVHHFCTLLGYGADAIHPYLAIAVLGRIAQDDESWRNQEPAKLVRRYREAIHYGLRKVLGKMGISTLESYKGAQIFEILGLNQEVVDLCFQGTASRIRGASFAILEQETAMRCRKVAQDAGDPFAAGIDNTGEYQWRVDGETHQWNPQSVSYLQLATQRDDQKYYNKFTAELNSDELRATTLRGLMNVKYEQEQSIPIDEVEPAEKIMQRFVTGAMSFGSISQEAHEALALAMNSIGGRSNTGEGGELSERYVPLPNGDSLRSAIKQVASGRFGVGIEYLVNADEIQIKMAQGAKPGEGGELPGHKVFAVIARTRNSTPGVGLISPPPHHDIYSIEDLAQLIYDLKNANPNARISVKLVSEVGVGTIAAGVAKGLANHILISGFSGGTGASPLTSIKHAGLPWELGLAETHQTLCNNGLRDRVVVQADGQLKCGHDVAVAAMLGAEEFGFSTAPLIVMGCIMMRVCHLNTCPVGIATQDESLRKQFRGRSEHVVRYFRFVAEELRGILSRLGMRSMDELIGRADLLQTDTSLLHWKSQDISLDDILLPNSHRVNTEATQRQYLHNKEELTDTLDAKILKEVRKSFTIHNSITLDYPIRNIDRTVGTLLSNYVASEYSVGHLADNSITINLTGSAGQSFGAWLAGGITLLLKGDANDYVGKGLSGGRIAISPPEGITYASHEAIILGNVALYGALSGDCYFNGQAAERFCVRNSGANAVVEGIGDHGCEYMTGGRVLVLGPIGKNFGAGMSGGIAYIWDHDGSMRKNINTGIVEVEELESEDCRTVLKLLREHYTYTKSQLAKKLLENFEEINEQFIRVISPAYRQIIELQRDRQASAAEREQEIVGG